MRLPPETQNTDGKHTFNLHRLKAFMCNNNISENHIFIIKTKNI